MADTNVQYLIEGVPHCFTCAVKEAVEKDKKVVLKTTDYGFTKCARCGDYLEDKVEI